MRPRAGLIFAFTLASFGIAHGQELELGTPTSTWVLPRNHTTELSKFESPLMPGISMNKVASFLNEALPVRQSLNTRGQQDMRVYAQTSPSVVLVLVDDALGSGIYIGQNLIVTNAHVVGKKAYAGVVFKPQIEGAKVETSSVVAANVLRVDAVKDLALIRASRIPDYVHPLKFGENTSIKVGADVYAIGHPQGQYWTFTRGLISQVRKEFAWKGQTGIQHRADVIQTQTPINPGNSGGPLIGDDGRLIGVNTFKAPDSEGINFAISLQEVTGFINSDRPSSATASSCEPTTLYEGRNSKDDGSVVQIDTDCDHKADVFIVKPDDPRKPVQALFDSRNTGKVDSIINDYNRDGLWDISLYDTKGDGKIALVGLHPDGDVKPSSYEKYDGSKRYSDFRGKRVVAKQ